MKKFVPYLLFSATTLHTILGISPVFATACGLHSEKVESVCEVDDTECKSKFSSNTTNKNI